MKTILIVDDEPRTIQPLRIIFQRSGYKVATAENGSRALEKLEILQIDLILLDIMMPPTWEKEGIEVCRHLRENGCTIPIVMLTNRGEEHVKEESLAAGASDFVVKPINSKKLLEKVIEHTQEHRETKSPKSNLDNLIVGLQLILLKLNELATS